MERGGYVLTDATGGPPELLLLASGSEVGLVLEASRLFREVRTRVVSLPSHELFAAQPASYRDAVLLPGVPRLAVEAAHPLSWARWLAPEDDVVGIERFGASAPAAKLFEAFGFTPTAVAARASALLQRSRDSG